MALAWRDLLYDRTEMETLVFAPRELAEEVRATRHALHVARSWGDVRRSLSPNACSNSASGSWPKRIPILTTTKRSRAMRWSTTAPGRGCTSPTSADGCLTRCFDEYGVYYDGLLDSGTVLPADDEDDIIEALTALGVRCEQDVDFLQDLFAEP